MKLNDIFLTEANWNNERIELWLKKMKIENFKINADKTVDVDGDVNLFNRGIDALPIRFGIVTGNFLVRHNKFSNLVGFPHTIGGDLSISHNPKISSFEKATTSKVGGSVFMNYISLTSLEGISAAFTEIGTTRTGGENFKISDYLYEIKAGGLGLMLIKGIDIGYTSDNYVMGKALTIIKTYFGKPDQLFDCQQELIEAGYEQFATL